MNTRHLLRLALVGALLLPSCAATMQTGGFTVVKADTELSFETVRARAAFDLECPKEKLDLVVLATEAGGWGGVLQAAQIGASGCGHKAAYVRTYSGWVLNSAAK